MQLSDVVIIYFVVGVVMVGGGAMDLDEAGIATFFIEEGSSGEVQPTGQAASEVDETGGSITTVVSLAVGAVVLVWQLALSLFNFLHWPILTLSQHDAPPIAIMLIGGGFTAAFYLAIIGILWRAA